MVKFREKREEYLNKLEGVSEKSGIFPAPGRRVASGEWRAILVLNFFHSINSLSFKQYLIFSYRLKSFF